MTDPDSMVSGGIENASMRRADRLFQIIQILRRSTRPVTATQMAEELELSVRTIYRDVADLIAQRVPIHGEAALGYLLDGEFDMPPLMLTPNEIEAAVLGAQWVVKQGDPELSGAARDLIAKIAATVPESLRRFIVEPSVGAPPGAVRPADGLNIAQVRTWIRSGHKIRIRYRDHNETESERTIWPTIIGYTETARYLAAWCELRQGFRHFRIDRIAAAEFLDERFACRPGELRIRWKRSVREDHGFTPQ